LILPNTSADEIAVHLPQVWHQRSIIIDDSMAEIVPLIPVKSAQIDHASEGKPMEYPIEHDEMRESFNESFMPRKAGA
jgi:hypothetical protein